MVILSPDLAVRVLSVGEHSLILSVELQRTTSDGQSRTFSSSFAISWFELAAFKGGPDVLLGMRINEAEKQVRKQAELVE